MVLEMQILRGLSCPEDKFKTSVWNRVLQVTHRSPPFKALGCVESILLAEWCSRRITFDLLVGHSRCYRTYAGYHLNRQLAPHASLVKQAKFMEKLTSLESNIGGHQQSSDHLAGPWDDLYPR